MKFTFYLPFKWFKALYAAAAGTLLTFHHQRLGATRRTRATKTGIKNTPVYVTTDELEAIRKFPLRKSRYHNAESLKRK